MIESSVLEGVMKNLKACRDGSCVDCDYYKTRGCAKQLINLAMEIMLDQQNSLLSYREQINELSDRLAGKNDEDQEEQRIQNCVDQIMAAEDVEDWAKSLIVERLYKESDPPKMVPDQYGYYHCPSCGAVIGCNQIFCVHCGRRVIRTQPGV